ncbi:MAG: FkbM family methyltransferase, partial [Thermoproteales archaeon]|nr:FkbM family methyltransferase [Thermoproteales archaeon]
IGRLERVDLLKLDVEGAELEILENSRGILNPKRVKRLIVEVHENIVKPSEVSQILEELGYEVVEYVAEDLLLQIFVYAADTLL